MKNSEWSRLRGRCSENEFCHSFVRVEESYPCGMALFYFIEYNYMAKNKVFIVSFLRDRHDKNLNIFFIYENMELFYIIVMQVRIEC